MPANLNSQMPKINFEKYQSEFNTKKKVIL